MLAVARNFDISETEKAFRLFVSWTVRFLIVGGGRSSSTEEAYAESAKEINQKKIKTAKSLASALSETIPTDAAFEAEFSTARVSKNSFARYYLRALELQVKGDRQPELIPNLRLGLVA
jgi:hypothetical protein